MKYFGVQTWMKEFLAENWVDFIDEEIFLKSAELWMPNYRCQESEKSGDWSKVKELVVNGAKIFSTTYMAQLRSI